MTDAVTWRVSFKPKNLELECRADETLYEAAARQFWRMPIACRNGVCQVCRAQLISGQMQEGAATLKQVQAGEQFMVCRARPLSDCCVEMKKVFGKGELPVNEYSCAVQAVRSLGEHIYQVELELPAGKLPERYAGQYLSLAIPEQNIESFFSIANAPEGRRIELHIQADPHIESAVKIIRALEQATTVKVSLPMGKAGILAKPEGEVILMAAGTGFAQMKAIIEQVFAWGAEVPVYLYWGVRTEKDMYLSELAEQWQAEQDNFHFYPSIADQQASADEAEDAHFDQLALSVLKQPHSLEKAQFFISGSPRLVYRSMDILEAEGASEAQFSSDVFEYAPRT